jgi:superfamily II DNA helicase RecQ
VQWGENFRPKYRQLGELKSIFNDASIVAVTATALVETEIEIAKVLRLLLTYRTVCTNTNRKNIKFIVHRRQLFVSLGGVDNSYHTCIVPFVESCECRRAFLRLLYLQV